MPGRAACVPVPCVTTARISPVRILAFSLEVTWTGFALLCRAGSLTTEVGERTPLLATVWATEAMPSGVASTLPCPKAVTERSVLVGSALSSAALGIVILFGWVAAVAEALYRLGV